MSTGKRQKHWSDRVHESIVSRNQSGQLNLTIKGGAEECHFPYFSSVKQDKVIYHSGKIQDSELLLEVNDESVVGLTLYDLNDLIRKAKDPVRFKTVKEGSILTKDLKEYLGKRFQDKTSVDHQLQATIRDNLYVRTLPCTTRKPRDGEIDGVNYTFMSVEKFEQMEKNGDFLEHGYYDGNYYGTPKPAITPIEAAAVAAQAAAETAMTEEHNNNQATTQEQQQHGGESTLSIASSTHSSSNLVDGKRRRRRSNVDINAQVSSLEASQANSSSNNNLLMVTTKNKTNNNESTEQTEKEENSELNGLSTTSLIGDNQATTTAATTNNTNTQQQPPAEDMKFDSNQVIVGADVNLGPLPNGWEIATTESGDSYFIDHIGKKTSWKDPRLDPAMRKKLEDCEDDELPNGWEKVTDPQYGTYYVDHLLKHTQFENPVLQAKGGGLPQQQQQETPSVTTTTTEATSAATQQPPPPPPPPPAMMHHQLHQQQEDMMMTTPSIQQPLNNGALIEEDVADSSIDRGLELKFTSNPEELLGTTHRVPIDKSSRGFGFTIIGGDEPQEFLQIKCIVPNGPASITGNIFEGDVIVRVNETCVLGWTHPDVVKLFQSISVGEIVTLELNRGYPLLVDPATSIVDTYAIKSDDKPMEEFERQLRMLNTHLEDPKVIEEMEPSLPNVYDEIPEYNSHYSASEYYPYSARPQHQLSRAASVNSIPPGPVVMQVIVEKGDKGFGFTVADSPQGQRVKHILDKQGCTDLLENDVLLEIDGTPVQCMPHNNVVDILKDYTRGDSAIIVIQRFPPQQVQYSPPPQHMMGGYPNGHVAMMPPPRHPYQQLSAGGQLTQSYMHLPNSQQLAPVQYETKYMGHGNASTISAPCLPMQASRNMMPVREQYLDHDSYIYGPPPHMQQFDNGAYQQQGSDVMSRISDGSGGGEYIYLNVVLHREESGFGFRILGGNTDEVTIGAIVPGGAADREGTLKSGDRLLTVDSQRIARLGHNEVVSLMGSAARNNVVKLGISRRIVQQPQKARVANPRAAGNWQPPQAHQQNKSSSYVMNAEVIPIVLHRKDGEGFGFVIISPNKVHDTNNAAVRGDPNLLYAPHKIGRITDDSPAAKCGQLRVDDRILAINGIDITNLHHPQIARIIKDSGFNIQLDVIPYRRGGGGGGSDVSAQPRHHQHRPQMNNNKSSLFQVELKRSSAGFGFGIRGGKEYNLPLYVLRIADDGPAAMCGEIQVGDMLIEINDVNVTDIPHSKAISLIKDGGHQVRLLVKKGDGNVPELSG